MQKARLLIVPVFAGLLILRLLGVLAATSTSVATNLPQPLLPETTSPLPPSIPNLQSPIPNPQSSYTTTITETWVTEPISNVRIYTRILQPDPTLYPGQQFPTVVLVPGGLGDGTPQVDKLEYQTLAAQGFIIVSFNAPGRGNGQPGNLQSGGVEDCNGFAGQNALKVVIEYTAALPNVDTGNIGVQTSSYGITMGAGVLGRYPDLPIQYLVDREGPSNNLITTFYYSGQERNLVCGRWSTITDPSPENVAWWSEREAYRYIGNFRGYYLRAQAEIDHAQPPGVYTHTLEMNNTAVISGVRWVRVNGMEMGNPINVTYTETNPAWLPGRLVDYHPDLTTNYIIEMARHFGAVATPTWQTALNLPHDVDRLENGHTLITAVHPQESKILEVDAEGNVVAIYIGETNFVHNADLLANGNTLLSDTGNDRVIELDAENQTIWSSEWITLSDGTTLDYPNDANWLPNDHLLITDRNNHRVIEVDRAGNAIWQFGETGVSGSGATHLNGPHNADRLDTGNTLIADSNNNRIIEVDGGGSIVWTYAPTGAGALDWPRDADRLDAGNTLITDSGNHRVVEVTVAGVVLWEYATDLNTPYDADRLENGNTLIANSMNNQVIEVDGTGDIVWEYPAQPESPDGAESPFGFHPASVSQASYPDNGFSDAEYIGVRWHRPPAYAYWFAIQPDLDDPAYNWSLYDAQYGSVPQGINILANITPDHPVITHGYTISGSYLPVDPGKYLAFVQATVERYDGDGVNDAPGLTNPVKYWQVSNEPRATLADFATLQRITYLAIKQACPDCTVLIGGAAGYPDGYIAGFNTVYAPILAELAGQYVDVFDFHWYGTAVGEYRLMDTVTGEDVYDHIRAALTASGFPPDLPLWITEMGSYSGNPAEPRFPSQTERQQAGDHFKRFIYSLSRGVKKVFPAFGLMEGFIHNDGYFDHTGLIYNGQGSDDLGLGVKKLGYYTYKKMTGKLEGADWDTLTTLRDGTGSDHLYLFSVEQDGQPVYIAWWDYFDEPGYTPGDTKPVTLTSLTGTAITVTTIVPAAGTGQDVGDYTTAFTVATYPISDGMATVPLGKDPVVITIFSQPVEGVAVSGPATLAVGETGMYTAAYTPLTATLPVTLTWDNGTVGATAVYSWTTPGTYTITVTATSAYGEVLDILQVQVTEDQQHRIYLPLIINIAPSTASKGKP